jgi:hypothetical protein
MAHLQTDQVIERVLGTQYKEDIPDFVLLRRVHHKIKKPHRHVLYLAERLSLE